ncbi:MAG: APC family permease [Myxococcales bacterium]|nr:APC family permease [Myxococcales bacterium]
MSPNVPVRLGFWSGVGLVVANMVGVGVLTSTGFMARDLGPAAILAAWLVGGVTALCGARAYAELALLIPRSGGEYCYISELLHPSLGYVAGWTSLLCGFSAPIAVAAAAAGSFVATIVPGIPPRAFAGGVIVLLTASHALDLRWSKRTQDLLAAAKVLLLVGFVAVGLTVGSHRLPEWRPAAPHDGAFAAFMVSLVYIAYAYSGWNTAVYAAEEFDEPRRTVPRALMVGTLLVTVFYLIVNWIFVANLSPERLARWTEGDTERITLGHLLIVDLAGAPAAKAMSALVILALISLCSVMILVGPRVLAAMARERLLPRVFDARAGRPPGVSVLLQSGLALALLATHSFELLMRNVGAILTLNSALTMVALFRARFGRTGLPRPSNGSLVAAGIYILLAFWMLWFAFRGSPITVAWVAGAAAVAFAAWFATRKAGEQT